MLASFALSAPPCNIVEIISLGKSFTGNPSIFKANSGFAPIAYISDIALDAAICPNIYGSSTIGVKKSTVCIINLLPCKRTTAASSELSYPTITRESFFCTTSPRTWARSSGPTLQAHPDPCDKVLNRICSFVFIKYYFLQYYG